jgi:hypothetical protein
MTKFKLVLWGVKDKRTGVVLIGHDSKPITNRTRKEAMRILKPGEKVIRIVMEEK